MVLKDNGDSTVTLVLTPAEYETVQRSMNLLTQHINGWLVATAIAQANLDWDTFKAAFASLSAADQAAITAKVQVAVIKPVTLLTAKVG